MPGSNLNAPNEISAAAELIAAAVGIVVAVEGDAQQAAAQIEAQRVAQLEDVADRSRHRIALGVVVAAGIQDAVEDVGFAEEGGRRDERVVVLLAEQPVASEHAASVGGVADGVEAQEGIEADIGRCIAGEQTEVQAVLLIEAEMLGGVEVEADRRREIVRAEAWAVAGLMPPPEIVKPSCSVCASWPDAKTPKVGEICTLPMPLARPRSMSIASRLMP